MRLNRKRAKALVGYDTGRIVKLAEEGYIQKLDSKLRERKKSLPAWLQWATPVPQRHKLRERANKEFWALVGPGRKLEKQAAACAEIQTRLKHRLEIAGEGNPVEIDEDDLRVLEDGFLAAEGKHPSTL